MTMKVEIDGAQVEVYTAAEVTERETATRTAVEGEYKPKLTAAEAESKRLEGLLEVRAGEFGKVRQLNEDQVAKLTVADRTIYENQQALAAEQKKTADANKLAHESAVTAALRSKTGTDEKLFTEAKKMYEIIGLDDMTPEGISARAAAAVGALGGTQPDLLASAGFVGGGYQPPQKNDGEKDFSDTERGKAVAAELGITLEAPKT